MTTEPMVRGIAHVQTTERETIGIQTGVDPPARPKATPGLQTFMNK